MTGRETVQAKALRYLSEGRVVVTGVLGDKVTAVCQGETGAYDLGHTPGRGWWCTCPVRTDKCSHLAALMLITVRRRPGTIPQAAPCTRSSQLGFTNARAMTALHSRATEGSHD